MKDKTLTAKEIDALCTIGYQKTLLSLSVHMSIQMKTKVRHEPCFFLDF